MDESPRGKNQKNITNYLLQKGDWMCAFKPTFLAYFIQVW